jgi:hypothetical protein
MTVMTVDTQPSVWAAAPGTDEGTLVGRNATTKLGFYGTTPIARPAIPTAATGTQIAAALAALGLVTLT